MLSDEQIKALWYKRKRPTVDGVYTHHLMEFARAVAEAAVKDAVGGDEPVATLEVTKEWEQFRRLPTSSLNQIPIGTHQLYTRPQASQLNLDYLREMGRLEARIRELEQASAAVPEVPQGAIHNGRAFADRLESEYKFECEAGPLHKCSDWQEFRRCFEHLAEWASMLAASQPEVKS